MSCASCQAGRYGVGSSGYSLARFGDSELPDDSLVPPSVATSSEEMTAQLQELTTGKRIAVLSSASSLADYAAWAFHLVEQQAKLTTNPEVLGHWVNAAQGYLSAYQKATGSVAAIPDIRSTLQAASSEAFLAWAGAQDASEAAASASTSSKKGLWIALGILGVAAAGTITAVAIARHRRGASA